MLDPDLEKQTDEFFDKLSKFVGDSNVSTIVGVKAMMRLSAATVFAMGGTAELFSMGAMEDFEEYVRAHTSKTQAS